MKVQELRGAGLDLRLHGRKLVVEPRERITPEMHAWLFRYGKEAIAFLAAEERAPEPSAQGPPACPPSPAATGPPAGTSATAARMGPPNTTPTPDIFFDEIAPTLGEGELRVMLYLIRRTFGFHRRSDAVSLTQFCAGIVTADGRRLDHGTGMGRRHVVAALDSLERRGLVRCERAERGGRGRMSRYALPLAGGEEGHKGFP